MTTTRLTIDELKSSLTDSLSLQGISYTEFEESSLDDFSDPDLRDLWILYHDLLVDIQAA
jgi:hypothetical protein